MSVIHKHPITIPICAITVPEGAELLDIQVQMQGGEMLGPVAWFLVPDPDASPETRKFIVAGTGQDISLEETTYGGTFQLGTYVGHVFEVNS